MLCKITKDHIDYRKYCQHIKKIEITHCRKNDCPYIQIWLLPVIYPVYPQHDQRKINDRVHKIGMIQSRHDHPLRIYINQTSKKNRQFFVLIIKTIHGECNTRQIISQKTQKCIKIFRVSGRNKHSQQIQRVSDHIIM